MAEEKKTNSAPAKPVTAVKKDDTKPGFFKRVGKWFREMRSELKKAVWPDGKTTAKNTGTALRSGETCALTVTASKVTDAGGATPAGNTVIDFTVATAGGTGYYSRVNTSSASQLRCSR